MLKTKKTSRKFRKQRLDHRPCDRNVTYHALVPSWAKRPQYSPRCYLGQPGCCLLLTPLPRIQIGRLRLRGYEEVWVSDPIHSDFTRHCNNGSSPGLFTFLQRLVERIEPPTTAIGMGALFKSYISGPGTERGERTRILLINTYGENVPMREGVVVLIYPMLLWAASFFSWTLSGIVIFGWLGSS